MPEKGEAKRRHIIRTANRLFYERGYHQTSFSDIAEASGIPRGNFYYYFKTKDDILAAVIDQRIVELGTMLEHWEARCRSPAERLKRYVEMIRSSREEVMRFGCPIGSLNVELGKAQPALKAKARKMFDVVRDWVARQFGAMGCAQNGKRLALHLLSRAQGVSVIAQAYGDARFLSEELGALESWIEGLATSPGRDGLRVHPG